MHHHDPAGRKVAFWYVGLGSAVIILLLLLL
jgi:hypothetical protein